MDERVAALMRAARQKKGLTQSDLAEALGVKDNTISNWEKGRATPNMDSFIAYCRECDVNGGDLLNKAVGDPTKMNEFHCTPDEAEMIRRYRFIDERGKRNVRRTLDAEYNDKMASLPEESTNATGAG